MPKKKKPQLKPVARGFATTSVPSKKAIANSESASTAGYSESKLDDAPNDNPGDTTVASTSTDPVNSEANDSKSAEEVFLQSIVERLQDKTEREIGRALKAIEFDRRMAKGYPRLDMDPAWVTRILYLVQSDTQHTSRLDANLNESEDKILPRLGVAYGTLRRLGFSEERVLGCLKENQTVDIEECFDWLCLNCDEHELVWQREPEQDLRTPRTPGLGFTYHTTPPTPSFSSKFPSLTASEDGSHDEQLPSTSPSPSRLDEATSRSSSLLRSTKDTSTIISDQDDEYSDGEDEADPNILYAIIRIKILRLQRGGAANRTNRLESLQSHLEKLKADYLFSSRLAEAEFASRRAVVDAQALQERLRDPKAPSVTEPRSRKQKPAPLSSSPKPPPEKIENQEEDEDDTMFGAFLDEMPSEEVTSTGTVIQIKNMAMPKHWSGKTPKSLLSEAIGRIDRYASVSFKIISGGSRAFRSACTVRWGGGIAAVWTMETVACYDSSQSEQYSATLALHGLAFPASPGFAGGSAVNVMATNYRVLPPIFRDLWNELEATRKLEEDALNRDIWSTLRTILKPKPGTAINQTKNTKIQEATSGTRVILPSNNSIDNASEYIINNFRARQASPSYQAMVPQRQKLPIAAYRQEIVDTLEKHQVLVLSGETGCGKSTQLPAFIMEDQLLKGKTCKIFCTEPRRISAISLAQRVSAEMGEAPGTVGTNGSLIGYSIRLESNIAKSTRLAFVTNGIALRMLEGGSGQGGAAAIDEVSHIIIDEVHERSIESDFLLIILKSLLEQRTDLKVVLMSATVDADKIAAFFGNCPTIHVPGRTFPVDIRYLEDAVEFSGWHITETSPYAKRQNDKYSRGKQAQMEWSEDTVDIVDEDEGGSSGPVVFEKRYSTQTATTVNLLNERMIPYELIVRLLERICFEDDAYAPYSAAILIFMPGLNEIRRLTEMLAVHQDFSSDLFRIYPLHSTVSSEGQAAVFDIPPPGIRKIVISSNISETGITIPDVTAVIDSGKHRQMTFDEKRQLSRLVETFIAKSNAAQRRGRAGRVRQGLCFHLFTKMRHDTMMAEHPVPEMLRLSLSDLALRTKIMKVKVGSSIEDILMKALDPPSQINVQRAVASLVEVRALTSTEDITPMGRLLSQLPTDVHLGKFLLMATVFKCLDPALTIAAALNSKSPFISPLGREEEAERAKAAFRVDNSDFLTIHNAFASWRRACGNGQNAARTLCRKSFLSYQNLQQIEEIRQQYLSYLIDSGFIRVEGSYERDLSRARYSLNRNRVRFVMVPPELDINSIPGKHWILNAALVAGLYPKILTIDNNNQMRTLGNNQLVFFHPSSINFGRKPTEVSAGGTCLTYFTLMQSKKLYAWETGPADDFALVLLCGEVDFKLASESIIVDRKIKYKVDAKTGVALKYLREKAQALLQARFRGKHSEQDAYENWSKVTLGILGKRLEEEITL